MNRIIIHHKLTAACKLVTVIVLFLAGVNLVVSNQLSTQGQDLAATNQQTLLLEQDITFLRQQIATASSLAFLDETAQGLGFIEITHPLALSPAESVAFAARE